MELGNSTRSVPKATYVRLQLENPVVEPGRALQKSSFLRSLNLQHGEVEQAFKMEEIMSHSSNSTEHPRGKNALFHSKNASHGHSQKQVGDISSTLHRFEGRKLPLELPSATSLAHIPASQLVDFGERLVSLRQAALDNTRVQQLVAGNKTSDTLGDQLNLLQTARAATALFSSSLAASPIGMLNLERLDMTPAGIEQGELIATIPLAPREKTNVVQQEWSTITQEFTSIVTDSLENYSETGVTESTELAQATTSQNAHSNQFNVTSSASGGCVFVTGSVSAGFSAQDQSSASATDSRKHAESTTKKASSRVTQSHQVTISTGTTSGSSTATTRTLENTSDTDPMRIDYFGMMRKWHIGLYRYGLRLTFDLTVPEPGAAIRQIYADMDTIEQGLAEKFQFPLKLADITVESYEQKAEDYGVKLPPQPPNPHIPLYVSAAIPNLKEDNDSSWIKNSIVLQIQAGYQIGKLKLDLILSNWDAVKGFSIVGCAVDTNIQAQQDRRIGIDLGDFLVGEQGTVTIIYFCQYFGDGMYGLHVDQTPTADTLLAWSTNVLGSIYDAALGDFTSKQTLRQARLQALKDQISGVDTLTLRREENDEIMKCVLRWLLGPDFQFVPDVVVSAIENGGGDLSHGIHFAGNETISSANWSIMSQYGQLITFINDAIEWESVVYFLYSYFWDDPVSWQFIRNLQHPDPTRQAFLRSGSARVVLTIRKGFETAFTWFQEQGNLNFPSTMPQTPYMSIAQKIEDYDNTNYPGIPPANPTGTVNIGGQHAGTYGVKQVDPGQSVRIAVEDASGFLVGNYLVIDTYESGVQERQVIADVIQAQNTLVVQQLDNQHGAKAKFPLYQGGERGLLIGEWFEYTPSHGTLIAVNSTLDAMA